jgi:hypothetical protein
VIAGVIVAVMVFSGDGGPAPPAGGATGGGPALSANHAATELDPFAFSYPSSWTVRLTVAGIGEYLSPVDVIDESAGGGFDWAAMSGVDPRDAVGLLAFGPTLGLDAAPSRGA